MNVLIIGGTGYMGRIAVQKMLERGDNVTVFSRGTSKPDWWTRVKHIAGDRNDHDAFRAKLKGKEFDAVIDAQAYRKEDVESAVTTFEGHVGRYLFISSGAVYLRGSLDFATHCPYKESDVDWSTIDYSYPPGQSEYGVGKRHGEKWLQENSKVPYTVIRLPAVMGPDDTTGRMWWWVQRALDSGGVIVPQGDHASFRTQYSADAAETWLRAIDSPKAANQIYHIASPEILSPERWVQTIWRAAGLLPQGGTRHEGKITCVPRDLLEKHEHFRNYSPPLTRSVASIYDLSKAERDFGIKATPLEEWIQLTVDWYRTQYHGNDSKGYEHRKEELALAKTWREKMAGLIAEM